MRPDDTREYIIDTGASRHAVSEDDLTESETATIRPTEEILVLETGNGDVTYDRECDVYVQSLKCIMTVLVAPKGAPSVLSVGKLVQDHGILFQWRPQGGARLTLPCGIERDCTQSNDVPYLAVQSRAKKGILKRPLPGTATVAAESDAGMSSTAAGSWSI